MTDEQLQWCKQLHDKYANKRFTVTEEVDGHCWGIMAGSALTMSKSESCLYCMMRRRDHKNGPCKGPQRITLRGSAT